MPPHPTPFDIFMFRFMITFTFCFTMGKVLWVGVALQNVGPDLATTLS
jgi:hypothetical protein